MMPSQCQRLSKRAPTPLLLLISADLLVGGPVSLTGSPPAAAWPKPKKRPRAKPKGGVKLCGHATAAMGPSNSGMAVWGFHRQRLHLRMR